MKKIYQQFRCSQIMLPEHRQELKKHREAFRKKNSRRLSMDEQEREHWDQLLQSSLETGTRLQITYLAPAGLQEATGIVKKVSRFPGCIHLHTPGGVIAVPFREITGVRLY